MPIHLPTPPQAVLLDIEGTTSSISFVHDVMFPFVLEHLESFLQQHAAREDVNQACEQIAQDAGWSSLVDWQTNSDKESTNDLVIDEVRRLMANDVKATGLKALQGLIWDVGFRSGVLKAHIYPDVIPAIQAWRMAGMDVRIYSSGSIAAQKLFFGHLAEAGNCLHLFSGHYDTTIGGKKLSESYTRIADDWNLPPANILFISDIAEELLAANRAGLQTLASVRPGNHGLPTNFHIPKIESFAEVPC